MSAAGGEGALRTERSGWGPGGSTRGRAALPVSGEEPSEDEPAHHLLPRLGILLARYLLYHLFIRIPTVIISTWYLKNCYDGTIFGECDHGTLT